MDNEEIDLTQLTELLTPFREANPWLFRRKLEDVA